MSFSRYQRKDFIQSVYCYEDSKVLINKLDIREEALLKEADTEYSVQRLLELAVQPVKGLFTINHLQNIHRYIFQDVYPFAGKLREEDISKGNTVFARSQHIKSYLSSILTKLKNESYLVGLPAHDFSIKVAYYMAEINIIHPFREGNGRATREFIRCLGLKCGYPLNWARVNPDKLLQASIQSISNTALWPNASWHAWRKMRYSFWLIRLFESCMVW